MALSLLTDEQISPAVAEQIRAKRAEIPVQSLQEWHGGAFLGKSDESLLRAAAQEGWTLVTYDRKTISPLLTEWGVTGEEHAGVLFIDELTILQGDIGRQVLALIAHWDQTQDWDWTDLISFQRSA